MVQGYHILAYSLNGFLTTLFPILIQLNKNIKNYFSKKQV